MAKEIKDGIFEQVIKSPDGLKYVDVITSEGKNRLGVDGIISNPPTLPIPVDVTGSSAGARFTPRFYNSKTAITLNESTDVELVNINFDGKIDCIKIVFDRSQVQTVIEIDGVEVLRIDNQDLDDDIIFDLHDGEKGTFFVDTDHNGEHFFLIWKNSPADITSNLTIKAKSLTPITVKMKAMIMAYRVKV